MLTLLFKLTSFNAIIAICVFAIIVFLLIVMEFSRPNHGEYDPDDDDRYFGKNDNDDWPTPPTVL